MFTPQEAAQRIIEIVRARGTTVNALLLNNRLSKKVVDNMKAGRMPSADKLAVLARALEVSVFYLLGMSDEERETYYIGEATNSSIAQGAGTTSGTVGTGEKLSAEAAELLRIYEALDVRNRIKLLSMAIEIEETTKNRTAD
jgi:hypothetical protein